MPAEGRRIWPLTLNMDYEFLPNQQIIILRGSSEISFVMVSDGSHPYSSWKRLALGVVNCTFCTVFTAYDMVCLLSPQKDEFV